VSYLIARQLVHVPFISLVNLISGKQVVPELIQDNFTSVNLVKELKTILNNTEKRQAMLDHYTELKKMLGGSGASFRCAKGILTALNEN
jgi:lipid-A-disaccharide synthase